MKEEQVHEYAVGEHFALSSSAGSGWTVLWDLTSCPHHLRPPLTLYSYFFNVYFYLFWLHPVLVACRIWFLDQGSNPGPLHWEPEVLITGSPGEPPCPLNSVEANFSIRIFSLAPISPSEGMCLTSGVILNLRFSQSWIRKDSCHLFQRRACFPGDCHAQCGHKEACVLEASGSLRRHPEDTLCWWTSSLHSGVQMDGCLWSLPVGLKHEPPPPWSSAPAHPLAKVFTEATRAPGAKVWVAGSPALRT